MITSNATPIETKRAVILKIIADAVVWKPPVVEKDSLPSALRNEQHNPANNPAELPEIQVNNRQLRYVVADAWMSVLRANTRPDIFTRDGCLVRLRRRDNALCIDMMAHNATFAHIANVATWLKITDRYTSNVHPPHDVVSAMSESPHVDLPQLEGVLTCPVFGKSGKVISTPGYDPVEKVWYEPPSGFSLPEVPKTPSPEDIALARDKLLELVCDFSFVSAADRAHWLAGLLLPFVRRMINGPTPLTYISAPGPGTGKSLLADLISDVATGRACHAQTLPREEAEISKTITSMLFEGQAIVLLDNQNAKVNSSALAAVLTSEHHAGRLLGQSRMLSLPNHATWIMTGNNSAMTTEIARRCVRVRLDTGLEQPWSRELREFKHPDLKDWALENRGRLVASIHTIVNAWLAAGKPEGTRSLGSFESWASVIGGILEIADVSDFLARENLDELYEAADSDTSDWTEFVQAWWDRHSAMPQKAAELNTLCEELNLLSNVRGDGGARSQVSSLGRRLQAHRDRVFGNLKLTVVHGAKGAKGGAMYQLFEQNCGHSGHQRTSETTKSATVSQLELSTCEVPADIADMNSTFTCGKMHIPDVHTRDAHAHARGSGKESAMSADVRQANM